MIEVALEGDRSIDHQVVQSQIVQTDLVAQGQGEIQVQIGPFTAAGQSQGNVDSRIVDLHEAAHFRPPVARRDVDIARDGTVVIGAVQIEAGKISRQGIRI